MNDLKIGMKNIESAGIKSRAFKVKKDEGLKISDAFRPTENVRPAGDELKSFAGGASKKAHSGEKVTIKDIVKSGVGGTCAAVGGVLGLAIGTVYVATVIGPVIGALYAIDGTRKSYFSEMVRHFVSPATLAVNGAKKGYAAGIESFYS